jgi:hypothetical protein
MNSPILICPSNTWGCQPILSGKWFFLMRPRLQYNKYKRAEAQQRTSLF